MTVNKLLAIAFVSSVLMTGSDALSAEPEKPASGDGVLVGTFWLATDIVGEGVAESVESTLGFIEAGKVAGRGGCNRFFGTVTIDGQSIEFGKMGSTMMACPPPMMEQEKRYLEALGNANRFEVKDGTLLVYGTSPDPLIQFTPTEPE